MTEAGSKAVAQRWGWGQGLGNGGGAGAKDPRIVEDQEWPRGPEYEI